MSDNFSKVQAVKNGLTQDGKAMTGDVSHLQTADQAVLFESLSAMMDGQVGELELRRVLKAMPDNAELGAKWQRFHVVRSSLQQEMHSRPAVNLLDGINARLAAEAIEPPTQKAQRFSNPVLRYIGQGAIAASFFAITIMVTSVLNQSDSDVQSTIAAAAANLDTPVLGGEYKTSELSRTVSLEGSLDEVALARLRQAVHQEFSGASTTAETPVSYTLDLPSTNTPKP